MSAIEEEDEKVSEPDSHKSSDAKDSKIEAPADAPKLNAEQPREVNGENAQEEEQKKPEVAGEDIEEPDDDNSSDSAAHGSAQEDSDDNEAAKSSTAAATTSNAKVEDLVKDEPDVD